MRLNPLLMEKLAGPEEYAAGRDLEEAGAVKTAEEDKGMIRYTVADQGLQAVTLTRRLVIHCDCDVFLHKGCCRHAVAVLFYADRRKVPESMMKKQAPETAAELTGMILREMPAEANVRLEVTLVLPQKAGQELRIGLRTGEKKLYVIKDIRGFLAATDENEVLQLGKDFTWQPEWMRYTDDDTRVLDVLRKLCAAQEPAARSGNSSANRLMRLPDPFARELLDLDGDTVLRIMDQSGKITHCKPLSGVQVPLHFAVNLGPRGLQVSGKIPPDLQPVTADCAWVMTGGNLIRTEKEQIQLIRLIYENQYEGRCIMEYPLDDTERVIGEVLPYLKIRGAVEIGEELRQRLVRLPLKSEVYLDKDGKSLRSIPSGQRRKRLHWIRVNSCCCGTRRASTGCWISWRMPVSAWAGRISA